MSMDENKTYGATFKYLREMKGYSLKEAAGDIVSPQFLGKFERDESGISVENFGRLLVRIGSTWEDFEDCFSGQSLKKILFASREIHSSISHFDFQEAIKCAKNNRISCSDNPFVEDLLETLTLLNLKTYKKVIDLKPYVKKIEQIKYYLEKNETWGVLEDYIYSQSINIFETDFVYICAKNYIKFIKTNSISENCSRRQIFNILVSSVTHLSEAGQFQQADDIIQEIEAILSSPIYCTFLQEKLHLSIVTSTNLLRQGRVEGLEIAKHIIQVIELFEKQFNTPILLIHRNDFIDLINKLNKTGVPFNLE